VKLWKRCVDYFFDGCDWNMKKRTFKYLDFFSKLLYLKSLIRQFNLQDARGNDVELSRYKGKVLLIVNVASQWLKFLYSFPDSLMSFSLLFMCVFLPDLVSLQWSDKFQLYWVGITRNMAKKVLYIHQLHICMCSSTSLKVSMANKHWCFP